MKIERYSTVGYYICEGYIGGQYYSGVGDDPTDALNRMFSNYKWSIYE